MRKLSAIKTTNGIHIISLKDQSSNLNRVLLSILYQHISTKYGLNFLMRKLKNKLLFTLLLRSLKTKRCARSLKFINRL